MSQRTEVVAVRVTPQEKELIEKLANYLYKLGKIEKPNLSDTLRVCLHFTTNELLKAIEAERYR